MDQVKKALAVAAKHQFWIITGLATLIGCVAWFMINSTLTKLFADNEKLIKDKVAAMGQVKQAVATHPNEDSKTEMDKIIQTLGTDVEEAWNEQFKRQEQFLQWREDAIKLPLLIAKLKKLYPIELKQTFPEEPKNITDEEKRRFSRYFSEQMPELAKIIGVTWLGEASENASAGGYGGAPGGMGGGSMGGRGGGMGGMGGGGLAGGGENEGGSDGSYSNAGHSVSTINDVVVWPKQSQDQLITSLKMWQGDKPSVYQMMYTQENMWILEGLFNIIEKTNRLENGNKATANFQAAVKKIDFIRIGRDAVANSGSISGVAAGTSGGEMGSGGMPGMGGSGMGMGGMGGSGGGGEAPSQIGMGSGEEGSAANTGSNFLRDPADGRYVDAAFKPITGDELRTKITSQTPEDAYFAVAKRVPVRLKIEIDFRRLPELLANCGNEGLMLEVRQVRVAATDTATGGYGSGDGAGMGGGMAGGMGGRGGGLQEWGGPVVRWWW
ncbi:MAG: hypothetical protein U0930_05800 [Pirellulales bacterium]